MTSEPSIPKFTGSSGLKLEDVTRTNTSPHRANGRGALSRMDTQLKFGGLQTDEMSFLTARIVGAVNCELVSPSCSESDNHQQQSMQNLKHRVSHLNRTAQTPLPIRVCTRVVYLLCCLCFEEGTKASLERVLPCMSVLYLPFGHHLFETVLNHTRPHAPKHPNTTYPWIASSKVNVLSTTTWKLPSAMIFDKKFKSSVHNPDSWYCSASKNSWVTFGGGLSTSK